jgi:hypothetical protein
VKWQTQILATLAARREKRIYTSANTVKFNIPEAEAVDRLNDLIREHGRWVEPPDQTAPAKVVG